MFELLDQQLEDIENNARTASMVNNDPFNVMKGVELQARLARCFLPGDE